MIATAIYVATAAGLGGIAGLLGGLFGVGGGFLVIPLLGFFYGMDQQTAQGTVLIMVVPNVLWAFSRYRRRFGIDLRMAATIAVSALIATYPTARLATSLDPYVLRVAFAVFLATTAATVPAAGGSGGSPPRNSPLGGRGECGARPARPLAGAWRDARLPSRGSLIDAGRSLGPWRRAKGAEGAGIARREHPVSFSIPRR